MNPEQMAHFAQSMAKWAKAGFHVVTKEQADERLAICGACELWEENGNAGFGKCRACGCSRGKMWLAHEQCPIGKWSKIPVDENPKPPV